MTGSIPARPTSAHPGEPHPEPSGMNDTRDLRDLKWMRRALELAARAVGQTSPNPLVGAVIVTSTPDGDRVLGEGFHRRAGLPHAEVEALRAAREAGHDVRGATIYVTLEPCCHVGRTGPCTRALIEAGVSRVVVAQTDPNPLVAGKGLRELRDAGLEVSAGLLDEAARALNASFSHWIISRRPHVTLKLAMSLDGRIAAAPGQRTAITSAAAIARVMELRRASDLVLVGTRTARIDDPRLTLRGLEPLGPLLPRRGVIDTHLELPDGLALFDHPNALVLTSAPPDHPRAEALRRRGVELVHAPLTAPAALIPTDTAPRPRIDLEAALAELGRLSPRPVTSILVEGGGVLAASLLSLGLVQRVLLHLAPRFLGPGAVPVIGSHTPDGHDLLAPGPLSARLPGLSFIAVRPLGPDLELELAPAPLPSTPAKDGA